MIRPSGQKVPAKGKGKAASPVYVNDSSEEGSTYKPSEPGHEEGEGGGKERGEEEVCLSHNLVEVLIYTGNRHCIRKNAFARLRVVKNRNTSQHLWIVFGFI